jgi:hypothetical protein
MNTAVYVARFITSLSLCAPKLVTNRMAILTQVREIKCCMFPLCMREGNYGRV